MLQEINKKIIEKEKQLNILKDDKCSYQTNMTSLNAMLSESFLPEKNYNQITNAKIEYQKSLDDTTKKMRHLKTEIRDLNMQRDEFRIDIDMIKVNENIKSLKDKYFEFYTDKTRISSMRKMAKDFIIDLDKIIKK